MDKTNNQCKIIAKIKLWCIKYWKPHQHEAHRFLACILLVMVVIYLSILSVMLAGAARQIHYYYKHIPATRLIAISSLLLQRFFSGRDLVENPYYRYLEEILKMTSH